MLAPDLPRLKGVCCVCWELMDSILILFNSLTLVGSNFNGNSKRCVVFIYSLWLLHWFFFQVLPLALPAHFPPWLKGVCVCLQPLNLTLILYRASKRTFLFIFVQYFWLDLVIFITISSQKYLCSKNQGDYCIITLNSLQGTLCYALILVGH